MDKRELVAQAIAESDGFEWEVCGHLQREAYFDNADAAIAAIEPAPVSVQEHARALLDAESDGEVWRTYVNAMTPILRADMSADSWHTVDEIRGAMTAALRALAGDEGER